MSGIVPRGMIIQAFLSMIVLLVFAEYFMFSYLSNRRITESGTKRLREYEAILCRLEMVERSVAKSNASCPTQGIVTTFQHWSLSKAMWLYTNVIAHSITTTLKPYVPICLKESLGRVFTNLSIPVLASIGHCIVPLPESVTSLEDWHDMSQSIVLTESELYKDLTMRYINTACREFVFNEDIKSVARNYLNKARRIVGDEKTVVYVAVYITRTSIILNQDDDDLYPDVSFFFGAMNYFRAKYVNTVFVVVCDREDIWRSIFKAKDIYIVGQDRLNNVGAALSILSHCNHTILASDGIAIWAAILSKGEAVLSISLSQDHNTIIKNYDNWIYLTNNSSPEIINAIGFN